MMGLLFPLLNIVASRSTKPLLFAHPSPPSEMVNILGRSFSFLNNRAFAVQLPLFLPLFPDRTGKGT